MRIAIIGGGSAYAPGLIRAFAGESAHFRGSHLALTDVNAEALALVGNLGKKLVATSGLSVSTHRERKAAIDGADIVLTTFRHGGLHARALDERIPLEFSVLGQETIGPGGFFFAQRTLPVMRDIAMEMEAYAPDATLVNYTNPTQIVAEAMARFTRTRTLSICDQVDDDRIHLARALGVEPSAIQLKARGVNHATWSSECRIEGQDGVPIIADHAEAWAERPDIPVRVRRQALLTAAYGAVPNGYLPYYYFRDESVAEAKLLRRTRAEVIADELPGIYAHFREQAARDVPVLTQGRGAAVFGDFAVHVIKAITSEHPTELTLNLANRGNPIPDLDEARIVEVPCQVVGRHITPIPQPPFTNAQGALIRALADYQAAAAEAIWASDPDAEVRALTANPLVLSRTLAQSLLKRRQEAG